MPRDGGRAGSGRRPAIVITGTACLAFLGSVAFWFPLLRACP